MENLKEKEMSKRKNLLEEKKSKTKKLLPKRYCFVQRARLSRDAGLRVIYAYPQARPALSVYGPFF